jgi:hypothetical protein
LLIAYQARYSPLFQKISVGWRKSGSAEVEGGSVLYLGIKVLNSRSLIQIFSQHLLQHFSFFLFLGLSTPDWLIDDKSVVLVAAS